MSEIAVSISPRPVTIRLSAVRQGAVCRMTATPVNGIAASATALNNAGVCAWTRNVAVSALFRVITGDVEEEYLAVEEGYLLTVDRGYLKVIKKEDEVIQD